MLDLSFSNIIHSNFINFTIMAAIIVWLCLKLNVAEKLEILRSGIENKVITSDKERENANKYLNDTKKSVENIEQEIAQIKDNAQQSAQKLADKIIDDTHKQIDKLEQNAQKNINAQTSKVQDELKQEISKMTLNKAKSKIEQILSENINMHKKLIDESIENLDKAKI